MATTALLSRGLRPAGRRLGVVGASGGAGELLAERATDVGLTLPLDEAARSALTEVLPDISSAQNPLDVTGIATSDPSPPLKALARLASGAEHVFDALVFQAFVLPGDVTDPALAARAAGAVRRDRSGRPRRTRAGRAAGPGVRAAVPAGPRDPGRGGPRSACRAPSTASPPSPTPPPGARSAELMHRQPPAPRDVTLDECLVGRALTEAESLDLVAWAGVPVVPTWSPGRPTRPSPQPRASAVRSP